MPKCDYEVIQVRHDSGDNSRIIRYKVKRLSGAWISQSNFELDRMGIFMRLNAKIKFGVRENPSCFDLIPIITENIGGQLYIKTIANNIPEDNLGNLPEF